jgi:hypothetical protein
VSFAVAPCGRSLQALKAKTLGIGLLKKSEEVENETINAYVGCPLNGLLKRTLRNPWPK